MKKSVPAKKTVLETILEWSQDRHVWQRDALRRIVSKGRLDGDDLEAIGWGRGEEGIGNQTFMVRLYFRLEPIG